MLNATSNNAVVSSDISATTFKVGLIGAGIQLSRTPRLHVVEGQSLGLDYTYNLLDIDEMPTDVTVKALLDQVEEEGYAGLNVTFPFKQKIIPFLDELSDSASRVGAVNTVVFRDGKRFGHNTDLFGFRESFVQGLGAVDMEQVVLIGAGGAGSAVAYGLLDLKVKNLAIWDVQVENSQKLAEQLRSESPETYITVLREIDDLPAYVSGVVNASPVGMAKLPGTPFPAYLLKQDMWVVDVIYFPLETEFLKLARDLGCRNLNGGGMAIYQAARAFELFCKKKPDINRMRETFDNHLIR